MSNRYLLCCWNAGWSLFPWFGKEELSTSRKSTWDDPASWALWWLCGSSNKKYGTHARDDNRKTGKISPVNDSRLSFSFREPLFILKDHVTIIIRYVSTSMFVKSKEHQSTSAKSYLYGRNCSPSRTETSSNFREDPNLPSKRRSGTFAGSSRQGTYVVDASRRAAQKADEIV